MPLPLNSKAPDFTLPSTTGREFTLSIDAKQMPLVLFFYPKDFTAGCTTEVCSFRDNFTEFHNLDVLVLGVSTDSIKSHEKFKAAHQLPFELLSDKDGRVSKLYKAKMPFLNVSRRVTYFINKNHRISAVHNDLFGAENHISEMVKQLKN